HRSSPTLLQGNRSLSSSLAIKKMCQRSCSHFLASVSRLRPLLLCLLAHPPQFLFFVRPLPVAVSLFEFICLRWRYGVTLGSIRRVAARRPAACPVQHCRPHGGGGGRYISSVRGSLPKVKLPQNKAFNQHNNER